jgi:hypothetical protein
MITKCDVDGNGNLIGAAGQRGRRMLPADAKIISVDDHVIEHPRVWLHRLPAKCAYVEPLESCCAPSHAARCPPPTAGSRPATEAGSTPTATCTPTGKQLRREVLAGPKPPPRPWAVPQPPPATLAFPQGEIKLACAFIPRFPMVSTHSNSRTGLMVAVCNCY